MSKVSHAAITRRLYTIADAALYLGRSEWSVASMLRSGALPYVSTGKRKFIDIQDINHWIEVSKERELD